METHCYYNESIAFFYNKSKKVMAGEWEPYYIIVMTLGMMVSIMAILANLLVIVAVYIEKKFHYPLYYLIGNLAASDLLAGISYLYLLFHTGPNTRKLSLSGWMFRQAMLDTSLTASVGNLLAIAVERHLTVMKMEVHSTMSNRRVFLAIACIWVIAIFMGAVPSMGWHCMCNIKSCSNMAPLYSNSYVIFWTALNLLIFFIMVVLYSRILYYVKQKTSRISKHTSLPAKRKEMTMQLLKTVCIVLGVFVICWTPGLVLLLLDVFCTTSCDLNAPEKFFLILAEINSALNPIIYSFRDKNMWKAFKRILCFCRHPDIRVQQTDSEKIEGALQNVKSVDKS
uniref:lysophosphatidic acid receptor 1-A-like n=1 Tax=Myxine glutinosa TaxID=7769 RepID=UPI00358F9377